MEGMVDGWWTGPMQSANAEMPVSALNEFAVCKVVVDLLVGVDVPIADVHAEVDRGVDFSRRG